MLAVMSAASLKKIVPMLLLCYCSASAQVSSTAARHWQRASPVGLGPPGLQLDQNLLRDTVRREILDTNTVRLIGQSVGLTEYERTLFQVAPDPSGEDVWFYTLSDESSEGCRRFAERLGAYVQARMDGHSRACLLDGITNRPIPATLSDSDLRILATNYPILPVSLFHKTDTGTRTNKAGQALGYSVTVTIVDGKRQSRTNYSHIPQVDEVCRWVAYTLVDGDIGWQYVLRFTVDGTLERIDSSKCDAKEFDPKFQTVIKEVNSEVEAEMKQHGTFGKFGSVHSWWRLKKRSSKQEALTGILLKN